MQSRNVLGAAVGMLVASVVLSGTAFAAAGDFNFTSALTDQFTDATRPGGDTAITTGPNRIVSSNPAVTYITFVNGTNDTILSAGASTAGATLGGYTPTSTDSTLQTFNGFFNEAITVTEVDTNASVTHSITGHFSGSLDNSSGLVNESIDQTSLTFTFADGTYTFSNFNPASVVPPGGNAATSTTIANVNFISAAAPEPSALVLLIPGVIGMVGFARRRKGSR